MTDEVRRLIYELVVEAKGVKKAEEAAKESKKALSDLAATAQKAGLALGAAFTLKGIAETLGNIQKVHSQLKVLGLTSTEAAQGLKDIENVAATTGSTIDEVSQVYAAAIEATQKLGGTQKDAAELAEAFTRAAKAEGKSAAEAAAQLDTLQFALDKGKVKAKEFSNILKENETFQQAAEKALGKTTAQIVAMAEAGELGSQELGKIIDQFKVLGQETDVPTTLEGITNSLKAAGAAFVNATADAAGLNESLSKGTGNWTTFLNVLRLVGTTLGYLFSLAFNFIETVGQGIIAINVAFVRALTGDFKGAADAFDLFTQQAKENVEDVAKAIDKMDKAWQDLANNNAGAAPGRQIGDPNFLADQAKQATIDAGVDAFFKDFEKQVEAAKKAREKANKEREAENQRHLIQEAKDNQEARDQEQQREQDLQDWFRETEEQAAQDASDILEREAREREVEFDKMWAEQREAAAQATQVIGGALEGLFDGGIHNARDFFREIAQGFAQLAASAAIKKFLKIFESSDGTGGFLGALLTGSAQGNVFDRGALVPFALGGVVSNPSVFPMAGGRMGIMGEAGAEAVMPLRRGADGKLGVAGSLPRIEIHNNLGVPARASIDKNSDRMQIVLEAAQLGANMAESRVNRSLRTGYGSTAQSMQRTYGLRRRF